MTRRVWKYEVEAALNEPELTWLSETPLTVRDHEGGLRSLWYAESMEKGRAS